MAQSLVQCTDVGHALTFALSSMHVRVYSFPVNILDPIRKHFGYGQLWPLRPACSQNRPQSYMPDPTSRIRFSFVFPKNAWIILHETDPDPIWMVWSGFGQTHLVWKQAGVQESLGPVSGRIQPARYQFTSFRLGSILPQTSWIILCKTSPHPIYFWLIVSGFGQTDPVRKQASVQESSGPLLAKAFRPIRTGSGMFTGVDLYQGFYNYCLAWTWFCHTNENAPAMIVNRSRLLSVLLCCRRTETKTGSAGIFFVFVFCFLFCCGCGF